MSAAIIADFSTEVEHTRRERPHGIDAARWLRSRQNAAKFFADCEHLSARRGWQVDTLFALPSNDRQGGLIWRIYGGGIVSLTADNATIAGSPASISVIRRPSQMRSEAEAPARGVFLDCRDTRAKASRRQADYAWSLLARALSWGLDRGHVDANPCERGGRLYQGSRAERGWTDENEAIHPGRVAAAAHGLDARSLDRTTPGRSAAALMVRL